MGGCCNDCASDAETQSVQPGSFVAAEGRQGAEDPGCCDGSTCVCDGENTFSVISSRHSCSASPLWPDTCFSQLARAICADDETHLHDKAKESCCDGDSCCADDQAGEPSGNAPPSTLSHRGCSFRRRLLLLR